MAGSQESQPFIIRIVLPSGEATDWRVDSAIAFHDVMDVLKRVMPETTPTAFEYEDEEGDRITVRTDDELVAMVSWHQWINSQRACNGIGPCPLLIYPRVSRNPVSRNVLGLTVNLAASPTDCGVKENNVNSGGSSGSSGRKQSDPEDLKTIISSGQIAQKDLHYLQIMGHGNGGTVYKSFHTPTKQIMAVKVIPLDITYDDQKRIISELEILFQCHSCHIIAFYGAFFLENKISICTEFMDGGSLDTYGTIPEIVLGSIAASVLKGLVYLWNLKIMHRDVKPSNMLVNSKGEVKLCDFGVSIQLVSSIAKTYVGTNAYMAPERILGDEYGIHSDVWSFGLSLVEMARGKFPYPQDGSNKVEGLLPIELLHCIVNETPPTLPSSSFSPQLVDFVVRCLQKAPKLRPTPDQLLKHDYIKLHDHGNLSIVSAFVTKRLEEMRTHSHSF